MKNAVPPTMPMASRPMTMTEAMTIEIQVFLVLLSITGSPDRLRQGYGGQEALRCHGIAWLPEQAFCFVCHRLIIIALAQGDRGLEFLARRRASALLERVVIPPFTVVQKDEGEAGILLVVSAVDGRFFDHLEAAFLAAAEADDISHPPERRRQRRHDVTVRADDQAGVLAARIELQH